MKAEVGIIIFFLTVGILSAWFHWYFVGDHRLRLVKTTTIEPGGAVLEVGKYYRLNDREIYFDDVSVKEILPNGDMVEIDWKAYGSNTVDGWYVVEPKPYYPYH